MMDHLISYLDHESFNPARIAQELQKDPQFRSHKFDAKKLNKEFWDLMMPAGGGNGPSEDDPHVAQDASRMWKTEVVPVLRAMGITV